jgi:hypothetical protein
MNWQPMAILDHWLYMFLTDVPWSRKFSPEVQKLYIIPDCVYSIFNLSDNAKATQNLEESVQC